MNFLHNSTVSKALGCRDTDDADDMQRRLAVPMRDFWLQIMPLRQVSSFGAPEQDLTGALAQ